MAAPTFGKRFATFALNDEITTPVHLHMIIMHNSSTDSANVVGLTVDGDQFMTVSLAAVETRIFAFIGRGYRVSDVKVTTLGTIGDGAASISIFFA